MRRPARAWGKVLETALEPDSRSFRVKLNTSSSLMKRPGDRKRAKLVEPEPEAKVPDEDTGVDLESPASAWMEPRVDVVDPLDDPQPRRKHCGTDEKY